VGCGERACRERAWRIGGWKVAVNVLSLVAAVLVSIPLGCYAARRLLFAVVALLPGRPLPAHGVLPSLAVLVAAHNEAAVVDRALAALSAIDYPPDRLRIVVVDDASDDGTAKLLERWAAGRSNALFLGLREPLGKAEALNLGIAAVPEAELIAVSDADQRPNPDCFRRIAEVFGDTGVGAVAGYLVPANAGATPIAHYAAMEAWVHQLVTSAAKDRLDLNPPMLGGACAYRRTALTQIGGFRPGAHGEDVESTVALTRAGWRTRFVPAARADNIVVQAWRDYWRQHIRWARSLFDTAAPVGRSARGRASVPIGRRLELGILSTGYLDRVALLAAAALAGAGLITAWIPLVYLASIVPGLLVAVWRAGTGIRAPAYLAWTAIFFALDVGASLAALLHHLRRSPRIWVRPERFQAASADRARRAPGLAPIGRDRHR
jgi:cellulose synthase/poly-beta-1,6-N-acetylglucosamine synthase-like glycosyltransferase